MARPETLSSDSASAETLIARSRQRSVETYRLDPGRDGAPRVLPASALREHRVPMEPLLAVARSGMETLFQQIRDAGYVVLLTDAKGVSVDFISNPVIDRELKRAGLYVGGCWSEEIEGTCAVGLCTIDKLPITVHHGEHFRALNSALTCSAAPVLAPDGRLLGVLDASALSSPDDKRSQYLVLQMVRHTARMIENANFLRLFEQQWVLRVNARREFLEVVTEGLLAIDGDGHIIAANQRFLHDTGCTGESLAGRSLEEVFGVRFDDIAAHAVRGAEPLALRLLHSGSRCFGMPRAPRRLAQPTPARREVAASRAAAAGDDVLTALAGADPRMAANVQQARRVVDKGITLLLHGESGTGKEAFAKALHHASARAAAPFVALNCAAIPESLIESELFGYRDGAFTGARAKGARGKVTQADGGTLFLDEIGDMPLAMQTRLLRVLAEREVLPLGAEQPVPVDLQVICATHRDLMELVQAGQFRLDLYYRLNGLALILPALRDRLDKADLIEAVLRDEARSLGRNAPHIAANAMGALLSHVWPGNIRELKSAVRAALALSDGDAIGLEHLPAGLVGAIQHALPPPRLSSLGFEAVTPAPTDDSAEPVREALLDALRQHRWNVSQAARSLQTCRATVYRRMQRFGVVPPNRRE
jgi:sigma-54 dependent transcriptional regulator, acetoin dehydrogenase operon transcriptional activator AcoR